MFVNFFRVFKFGWQEISRNLGISVATIFIMFISLTLVGGTLVLQRLSKNLVMTLQEKADISVFFKEDTKEEDIYKIKERIENFPEVKEVEYVSKEKALEKFKEVHKDNPSIMESLQLIGKNPLPASLNIRADSSAAYEKLANFLEKGEYKDFIEKVNYRQNQMIIDRLFSISENIKTSGLIISCILIFIAFVMTFNTIRLAIYSRRKEIAIMKLIGATNWFVRGPFLIQGILVGLFAGIISFLLFYGIDSLLSPDNLGIFGELGLADFFEENVLTLLLIQVGGGVLLGLVSSFFATQKYLKY